MTNDWLSSQEFEDPLILFADYKLTTVNQIVPSLELAAKERKKLVIIAENVEGDALATLILNKIRTGLPVVAIKAPGFGDNRKALLQDMAILTGGEVMSEEIGTKAEKIESSQLGKAKKIEVSADDTIILDGFGDKSAIKERCDQLRNAIDQTTSEYEKDKLKERLGKLSGGVAVLKVRFSFNCYLQNRVREKREM